MALQSRLISNRLIQPKKPKLDFSKAFQPSWGKPLAPQGPTPFSPTTSQAGSVGNNSSAIPQSDPRDAQYFNDVAKLDQYYQTNKANLGASAQELARNLTKNQAELAEQQPKDELSAKQNANKAGLFYSGALGKNLGDISENYAKRRSELQTGYESQSGSIARQLQDLETNYGGNGLMRNDALLGGVGRATAADQANALSYVQNQPPPSAIPYTTQQGTSKAGVPGVWHIYPGGRKVFVRK
jgi:hypothetical protein